MYKTFDNYEDARQFVKSQGMDFRREASTRGYQPARTYAVLDYFGRYGEGLTIERPCKDGFGSGRHSNQYHCIEYWIKK